MKNFFQDKVSFGVFLFFIFYGIFNIFYGEKTQVRGGFFYDGSVYADITIHFEDLVFHKGAGADAYKQDSDQFTHGISDYLLQRILPLGLAHYSIRILGANFSNENVVRAFEVWNLIYLLVSIFVWHLILQKLALNSLMKLLSYALIYINFAFLKLNFYYPVLTDTPAFMLMMLTLWAWLYHRPVTQLLILVLGAFTWPSFFYLSGVLLFFMPNKQDDIYDEQSTIKNWATPLAGLFIIVFLTWVFFLKHNNDGVMSYFEGEWDAEKINRRWLPFSLVFLLIYMLGLLYHLFKLNTKKLFNWKSYFTSYHVLSGMVLVLLFIAIKLIIKHLQGPETVSGMKLYVRNAFLRSCTDPLTFLVSNIQYFGVLFILLVFYLKSFVRTVQRHGLGAVLVIAMITVFSINSESRQITYILPILCYFLMPRISELNLTKYQVLGLVVCSFLLSKVWLPLNHGQYINVPTSFPDQWYFMNMGPWMSHRSYGLFAATAGIMAITVWLLVKPSKRIGN